MPMLRDDSIEARIYGRSRGSRPRYYADFRDFADVGGSQEPMIPAGDRYAATDYDAAVKLATARLEALEEKRSALPRGESGARTFDAIIPEHLRLKVRDKEATTQWLGNVQVHLETAAGYFKPERDLATIGVSEVKDYGAYLQTLSNGRGGTLSSQSVNQYLTSLSNLFERAIEKELIEMGKNPVSALKNKPKVTNMATPWLEVHEFARVLKFAFEEYEPERDDLAIGFFPEIVSTIGLTGCREAEILGLRRCEVNLDRGVIIIQPNEWRRLKTDGSERVVRIFSQLGEILGAYLTGTQAPTGDLIFPSQRGSQESMITDLRKAFDKMPMPDRLHRLRTAPEIKREEERRLPLIDRWLGNGRGPKPKESLEDLLAPIDRYVLPPLRSRMLRHTYCSARLQTTDNGKPISPYTVSQELGHADLKMILKIYAHLGNFRARGEEVEYRW